MKILLVLAAFLIVSAVGQDDIFTEPVLIDSPNVPTIEKVCNDASKIGQTYCDSNLTPACDAKQVLACTGVKEGKTYNCDTPFPYCSGASGDATCSNVRDPFCISTAFTFNCNGLGFYPDASNCKIFYHCYYDATNKLIADQYQCLPGSVFDPSGKKNEYCRYTEDKYCVTAQCDGTVKNVLLKYRYFTSDKGQVVASCKADKTALVFRCDAGFVANLNTLPVRCELICKKAVKKADSNDPTKTKYFECARDGKNWKVYRRTCFVGFYFDAKLEYCVVKPTVA